MTEAGEVLARHARPLLAQQQRLRQAMHAFACGQRGTLRLFANTSAMSAFLPGKLAAWMAAHPAVQIETEERTSADIVSCILAGVAQAGVVSDAVDPGPLRLDPVADDPLVLIVPPAHPLAEKEEVAFAAVLNEPLVALYQTSALQQHIEQHAAELGQALNVRVRMSHFAGLCEMVAPACQPQAIYCQMGTIGLPETRQAIALLRELQPAMTYIDAPVSGTKAPAEKAQILVLASGDREKGAAAEPVFAAISRGTQWFGEAGNSQKMKLVLNAWLISMMQGIAESAQLAKTLGFTPDQLWSALEGGPLAAPYVKVKLDAIASEQFTPQMQLAHALKDARLALSLAEPHTMPGLENIAELWQQAADAGYAGEDLSAVYQWLSPSSKA
nr:LysR substrate-binding domain-containing protein [Klebsiella pneumoniae]